MDLNRIDKLRQAETICLFPNQETNISRKEFEELLDAAEAWSFLVQEPGTLYPPGICPPSGWVCARPYRQDEAPTPQAAALAALSGKEKTQ